MAPPIDPALLRALSLDPATSKITSHGGSGFASTFRITNSTRPPMSFFVKTSSSPDAATMFQGEHASLNAIHSAVPSLGPRSFAWGAMEQQQKEQENHSFFLATEFLDLGGIRKGEGKNKVTGSGLSLAQKLAKLHTTPAPIPEGYDTPQFGFPVTTCCGDTPQPNTFSTSWADFFAENRLRFILQRGESRNGSDPKLRQLVEKTVDIVVPRLLRPGHLGGDRGIVPVVVHGDLWSGNHGRGVFLGRNGRSDKNSSSNKNSNNNSRSQLNTPSSSSALAKSAAAAEQDEEDMEEVEDTIREEEQRQERDEEQEEAVTYDPSSCYAHSEYELGIMRMFGGFGGSSFLRDYHALVPKTDPVAEYDDRLRLYEAYHHLNHWAIFGGGYRAGAVRLLMGLVEKFG